LTLTVSQLAANEANLALTIAGDTLNLVYFPNRVSTKSLTQLDNGLDGMNATLAEIIKSWDLLQDDGSMYPLDADSLAALGINLLLQVAKGIVGDIRPN
jgi:hypothetical protein